MMRSAAIFAIAAAMGCGGEDGAPPSGACAGLEALLVVRIVDETGAAVLAERVRWQDAEVADEFWDGSFVAMCAGGGAAPCSEWVIDSADVPERILVTAAWQGPVVDGRPCTSYASTLASVGGLRAAPIVRQRIELVLPSTATWCDGEMMLGTGGGAREYTVAAATDCRAAEASSDGRITLRLVDEAGATVIGHGAQWYYPPKSPAYDGEHALVCGAADCSVWVSVPGDEPAGGPVYFTGSAIGPTTPRYTGDDLSHTGYGATMVMADDGSPLDLTVTLSFAYAQRGDPLP